SATGVCRHSDPTRIPLRGRRIGDNASIEACDLRVGLVARGWMMSNRRPFIAGTVLVMVLLGIPTGVLATQRFGPVELSGNLQTTNLVRHPDAETYQYVQNRNVARIRLDYAWLQG